MKQYLGGIYSITVDGVGDYYGESADIPRRWARHRLLLIRGRHTNYKLNAAWKALGAKAFTFKVIEQNQLLTENKSLRLLKERALIVSNPLCLNIKDSKSVSVTYYQLPLRDIYRNRIVRIARIRKSALVRICDEQNRLLGIETVEGTFRMGRFSTDNECVLRRMKA